MHVNDLEEHPAPLPFHTSATSLGRYRSTRHTPYANCSLVDVASLRVPTPLTRSDPSRQALICVASSPGCLYADGAWPSHLPSNDNDNNHTNARQRPQSALTPRLVQLLTATPSARPHRSRTDPPNPLWRLGQLLPLLRAQPVHPRRVPRRRQPPRYPNRPRQALSRERVSEQATLPTQPDPRPFPAVNQSCVHSISRHAICSFVFGVRSAPHTHRGSICVRCRVCCAPYSSSRGGSPALPPNAPQGQSGGGYGGARAHPCPCCRPCRPQHQPRLPSRAGALRQR